MTDWFEELFGFRERSPVHVHKQLLLDGTHLRSRANGEVYQCGRLEILSLGELRERVPSPEQGTASLRVSEMVGDAKALHADRANAGALFQVASQFNLLEMVSPNVTPERGITIYANDPTQGPACAIACGAGTIYRNYFVELEGQLGQTAERQVDCLEDIGETLGNHAAQLWQSKNGYALPSLEGLKQIDDALAEMTDDELDSLRAKLKIGVQWDTQVTLHGCDQLVSQAYCSAMPVAYSGLPRQLWKRFASLILEAAYEATLAAAVLNTSNHGNKPLYLTLLGGGAFGNEQAWILDAIQRACVSFKDHSLNVKIVSFRSSSEAVRKIVDDISKQIRIYPTVQTSETKHTAAGKTIADHHCPGCGASQRVFLRYPWYFCQSCLNLAEDGTGRRLEFGNMSLSGGLFWKYADSTELGEENCGTVLCLIHGRPVVVAEARFGGVVAQPVNSANVGLGSARNVSDLRRKR